MIFLVSHCNHLAIVRQALKNTFDFKASSNLNNFFLKNIKFQKIEKKITSHIN